MAGAHLGSRFRVRACVFLSVAASVGCGSNQPSRVNPPPLDPTAIATAAVVIADADGDGILAGRELQAVPAISMLLDSTDADKDQRLTVKEIRSWLEAVRNSRVAVTSCRCGVTQNGRPLKGVTVRLVPCSFMSRQTMPAEGITDAAGFARPTMADSPYEGVHCGLYRVELEGVGLDGKPLPARYNTASTLGLAIGGTLPEGGRAVFAVQ